MFKRVAVWFLALTLLCFSVPAFAIVYGPITTDNGSADPCLNANIAKQSVPVGVTNGVAKITDAATGETVYVCKLIGVASGTTPAIQIQSGISNSTTPCYTGVSNVTGLMAPTSGSVISTGGGGAIGNAAASSGACILVNGSSNAAFNGVVTFIQR